jgi:hypothetical protein
MATRKKLTTSGDNSFVSGFAAGYGSGDSNTKKSRAKKKAATTGKKVAAAKRRTGTAPRGR